MCHKTVIHNRENSKATYMAHCIPCFAKADEIGVSGSIAKYGTRPTITMETAMYNAQQIAKATPIPNGRSLWGFFTCKGQKRVRINNACNISARALADGTLPLQLY